jgi:hypothetical protein
MRAPATIEQHSPFSRERAVKVRSGQLRTNDPVRNGGIADPDMRDLTLAQSRAVLGPNGPELRVRPIDVRFE